MNEIELRQVSLVICDKFLKGFLYLMNLYVKGYFFKLAFFSLRNTDITDKSLPDTRAAVIRQMFELQA